MHYTALMKTATIPSIRVKPELRAEMESLLAEGETLSQFVESSVMASLARRRHQAEFIARGMASLEAARKNQDYVEVDEVMEILTEKLRRAKAHMAQAGKTD